MADTPDIPESQPFMLVDNSNPLHQFRSYSYHFFLVACESTDVLNYLSSPAATNAFERTQNLADLKSGHPDQPYPRNIITAKDVNGKPIGNYVIVIDTRHDVDFIIEEVQWGTTFLGDQNTSNSSVALNVVMTDGIINFMEPRGVNFLNVLANLGDQLDVDMICMPFCLKTIFYGHTDDGKVIPLNTTQPFGFVPVDIKGTVDERGTSYKMDIVGVTNGVVYNPSYNAIVDNVSFPITVGHSLEDHLATFTDKINDTYTQERRLVQIATKDTIDLTDSATVVYNIQLEPNSDKLAYLKDFGTNIPDQNRVDYENHIIKGTKEGGIPEVIWKLLASSTEWTEIGAQGDPPNETDIDKLNGRYTFKITQQFASSSPSISKSQITVYIYVSEYKYETVDVVSTPAGRVTQTPTPKIDPKDVVTFDYIFTGQNVDILGMEIDMSMGLALLQTLATGKAMSSQAADATGRQPGTPNIVAAAPLAATGPMNIRGKLRKGTPIFAPFQWATDYLKEMKDVQSTATADAIWKNFAGYQSVNTTLNIHGNPLLLAKIIDPSRSVPNYVKVNIRMPNTPDDIWEYQLSGNRTPGGYYKDFWYTEPYLIISATNKFSGGLFTQQLELVSLPQTSSTQGKTSAVDTALDNIEKARDHFFNTSTTTPPVSNTTPTGPITHRSASDFRIANPTFSNPASATRMQFVANYWNYALQAAKTTGLNPDFTLAQAAVETGYGTNTLGPHYNSFFSERAFKSSKFQSGIAGGSMYRKKDPYAAYPSITNSFLDQSSTLHNLYPKSVSATDITTYANGLAHGKGNAIWDPDDADYVSNIIDAYSEIQTYKANLGIQPNTYYTGSPIPSPPTQPTNFVAMSTPAASSPSTSSSTNTTYATDRSVGQAAVAQKATVFSST